MNRPTVQQAYKTLATARTSKCRLAVAAITAIVTATVLAVCAAAGSWTTVSGLAAREGISLHWLAPVEIDGGLVGVIALDIALTWAGIPLWWLRLTARIFGAGTVLANAAAGLPSLTGAGLRCAAPMLIVAITEAGRSALLAPARADQRDKKQDERRERMKDRIPRIRWLLEPCGTFRLWRRMQLWGETSYAKALRAELQRRAAISKLEAVHGPGKWRSAIPADLMLMLDSGISATEAFDRVRDLTETPRRKAGQTASEPGDSSAGLSSAAPAPAPDGHPPAGDGLDRHVAPRLPPGPADDLERRARELLRERPELAQRGKGAEVGRILGVSESTGRRVLKRIQDRDKTELADTAVQAEPVQHRQADTAIWTGMPPPDSDADPPGGWLTGG